MNIKSCGYWNVQDPVGNESPSDNDEGTLKQDKASLHF